MTGASIRFLHLGIVIEHLGKSILYLVLILPIMALLSASACCAVLQWLCMKPNDRAESGDVL